MVTIILTGPPASGKSRVAGLIRNTLRYTGIEFTIIETNLDIQVPEADRG